MESDQRENFRHFLLRKPEPNLRNIVRQDNNDNNNNTNDDNNNNNNNNNDYNNNNNSTGNMRRERKTKKNKTRKQKWEEKQLYGYFKQLTGEIVHEKTSIWL